jgi:hypothetical protein
MRVEIDLYSVNEEKRKELFAFLLKKDIPWVEQFEGVSKNESFGNVHCSWKWKNGGVYRCCTEMIRK